MEHIDAENLSLRYHQAIADIIRENPACLQKVKERALRRLTLLDDESSEVYWINTWLPKLEMPVAELTAFLCAHDETAKHYRQSTIFLGVLSNQERWAIRKSYFEKA